MKSNWINPNISKRPISIRSVEISFNTPGNSVAYARYRGSTSCDEVASEECIDHRTQNHQHYICHDKGHHKALGTLLLNDAIHLSTYDSVGV